MSEYKFYVEVDRFKSHAHSNAISTRGKFAKVYKKKENALYEEDIVNQLKKQFKKYKNIQIDDPIKMTLIYQIRIPSTLNKKNLKVAEKKKLQENHANKKPDLTNITKTIEDCIERAGIVSDDLNITQHEEYKFYNSCYKEKKESVLIKLSGTMELSDVIW